MAIVLKYSMEQVSSYVNNVIKTQFIFISFYLERQSFI